MSLAKAQADLTMKPGRPLEVEQLRKAVIEAGFTPTWIRVEAIGLLLKQDGSHGLRIPESDQVIPLEANEILDRLLRTPGAVGRPIAATVLIPKGKGAGTLEQAEQR